MSGFEEIYAHEPLAARIQRQAYDRLIALSDGVFAFAATLLALEVHIPPGWNGEIATLVTTDSVTKLIGYVVSFTVVAIYWLGNRRILSMFRYVDGIASFLGVCVLMLVALLPPVSQTLMIGGRFTSAVLFYVGYVTLIGWMQALLWGYGVFIAKLAHPQVDTRTKWVILLWMLVVPTTGSGLAIYASRVSAGYGYIGAIVVMGAMILLRHRVMRVPNKDTVH